MLDDSSLPKQRTFEDLFRNKRARPSRPRFGRQTLRKQPRARIAPFCVVAVVVTFGERSRCERPHSLVPSRTWLVFRKVRV